MRGFMIVVDLFVMQTIIAFILFVVALGNSAPHKQTISLTYIEVEAEALNAASGTAAPAVTLMKLRAELRDESGANVPGSVLQVPGTSEDKLTYLVRNAPEGAELKLLIEEISPQAFDYETLRVRMTRVYPGPYLETEKLDSAMGSARVSTIKVSE